MCIWFSLDMVSNALDKQDVKAIQVLQALELSLKKGKHLIFAKRDVLEYIKERSRAQYPTLCGLLDRYAEIAAYALAMPWHAQLVIDRPSFRDEANRILYINIYEATKLELIEETHLIGEHLKDIDCIKHIGAFYARTHKLGTQYLFYPLLGGGSVTFFVYENEIKLGKTFVLCITDSDRKYPDGPLGDTGKNVAGIDRRYQFPALTYQYQMKNVLEMENLIPCKVIQKYVVDSSDEEMTKRLAVLEKLREKKPESSDYFDYKTGITKTPPTDQKLADYQIDVARSISPDIADEMREDEARFKEQYRHMMEHKIAKDANEADKIIKYIQKKTTYIPGLGEKLLECVLKNCEKELANIQETDLSATQQKEYEQIGELVCSWTCCLAPSYS